MLTKTEKSFTILFLIIVIIHLICDNVQSLTALHYITKPAIVTLLILFFLKHSKHLHTSTRRITLLALAFSLLGDVLLMFVDTSSLFFITGLIAFLIAHVMYVLVFLKKKNATVKPYGFVIILLLYACGLFYVLKDGLGNLLIPVILYMTVILSMSTSAFIRKGTVSKLSYLLVFVGALFFMVSDSILATNKFYEPLTYSGISIMLTYAIAQYLIVIGILKQGN